MDKIESYYNLLDQWTKFYGYESITVNAQAGADRVYKRSRVEASKFGKVDAYICAIYMHEGATGADLKSFSERMFSLANRHRTGAPLGFGAMMVVYPLIISENVSAELASFLKTYCPKHFAAAEFPAAYDLNTEGLYFYESTPVWGYAYYAGYRREVSHVFSPKSWREVTAGNVNKS